MSENLKPFTNYICPAGHGRPGHSSHYTGAYRESSRRPTDGTCLCGAKLVEESATRDGYTYRLIWESIDPHQAEALAFRYGKGVWPTLPPDQWEGLFWLPPTSREEEAPLALRAQYDTLRGWAETHEQPVRNVRLLRRPSADGEWQPMDC